MKLFTIIAMALSLALVGVNAEAKGKGKKGATGHSFPSKAPKKGK